MGIMDNGGHVPEPAEEDPVPSPEPAELKKIASLVGRTIGPLAALSQEGRVRVLNSLTEIVCDREPPPKTPLEILNDFVPYFQMIYELLYSGKQQWPPPPTGTTPPKPTPVGVEVKGPFADHLRKMMPAVNRFLTAHQSGDPALMLEAIKSLQTEMDELEQQVRATIS